MDAAKHLLGRTLSDAYGAAVGKIVGISTDVKSRVTSVEVELGNGQFLNCSPSQIVIDEKGVRLLDEWKVEAESLRTEFDLAVKRMNALSELHKQGDIQPEIYEDFRRNHEIGLRELEARKEALTKKLSSVCARLDEQVRELEMFLATNKMQLASGEIDPQAYKIAADSIEGGLNRAFSAKTDIEKLSTNITSLKDSHLGDHTREQHASTGLEVARSTTSETSRLLRLNLTDRQLV
jgi:hypothetical protein